MKTIHVNVGCEAFIKIGVTCISLPYSHRYFKFSLVLALAATSVFLSLTLQYRLSAYTSCSNLWLKIMGLNSNSFAEYASTLYYKSWDQINTFQAHSHHFPQHLPFFFFWELYPGFCNRSLCILTARVFWSQLLSVVSPSPDVDGCLGSLMSHRMCLLLS